MGLLLPCNVVVRLGGAESDTLRSLAEEVRGRMARVIEAVGKNRQSRPYPTSLIFTEKSGLPCHRRIRSLARHRSRAV